MKLRIKIETTVGNKEIFYTQKKIFGLFWVPLSWPLEGLRIFYLRDAYAELREYRKDIEGEKNSKIKSTRHGYYD